LEIIISNYIFKTGGFIILFYILTAKGRKAFTYKGTLNKNAFLLLIKNKKGALF
jgi:hypothetical protein